MTLPIVTCPACHAKMSLEAMIGHQGAGDALKAAAELHPAVRRILWPAFQYVNLFAPAKQALRWDRIGSLMQEVGEMVGTGRVERHGQSYPAPLDYWLAGIEEMLAKRDSLRLPLTSHGYLKSIVASLGNRAEVQAEKAAEERAAGRTPVGFVGAASGRELPAAPVRGQEAAPTAAFPPPFVRPDAARVRPPPETFDAMRAAIGRMVTLPSNPSAPTQETPEA